MGSDAPAMHAVDLTSCDREPIHIPGSIQPHGCLLALEPGDLRVVQAGGAAAELVGARPETLLSKPIEGWSGARMAAVLRSCADLGPEARRLFAYEAGPQARGTPPSATVHVSEGLLVLELEPGLLVTPQVEDSFGLVQELTRRIQQTASVSDLCQTAAECVRDVSGFDRVMIYRFLPDGAGRVEAEALSEGMESYLGLRYPASDIPKQARDLYLRNTVRLIPDARYSPAPLLAWPERAGKSPLDLSQSVLRSVSPVHLEYLANMGVAASMSLSLVVEGQLWGLIACHHRSPRFLHARIRTALDLFARIASFQLETRLAAEALAARGRSQQLHEGLMAELSPEEDVASGLGRALQTLLDCIPATGMVLRIGGGYDAIGKTPPREAVLSLIDWLDGVMSETVFHTDHLAAHYPEAADLGPAASGVLAVCISRPSRDFLVWFRPEQTQTVRWAGDPNKPVTAGAEGDRLSPRRSFAVWREQMRGRSEPWDTVDIGAAQSLRVSLLEVMVEQTGRLVREGRRSRDRQDDLLVQLDERIARWETSAQQLKSENDQRAMVGRELTEVLRQTVIDQERERQRIARELHDGLGQYLAAMKLDLDLIARDREASESIRARADRLRRLTAEVGRDLHDLASNLRPAALDHLGLEAAIEQLADQWRERSALILDLRLGLNGRRLPSSLETALYRALEDALAALAHGGRIGRLVLSLSATPREAQLIVEDAEAQTQHGDEARPSSMSAASLALLGIRERLALVGGELDVMSEEGRPRALRIRVPLRTAAGPAT